MSQMISYQTAVPYLTKDTTFLYLNLATLSLIFMISFIYTYAVI